MQQLNNRFKVARILKGLTQHDVAQKSSPRISPARLSLFENGYIELREEEIEDLEQILQLSENPLLVN